MPGFIKAYVNHVDRFNRIVGLISMYLLFGIMGILLFSSISRYCFNFPVIWGVEMAQFCMVAYYLLGGGFALLLNSHVRMDVLYSRWKPRKQAKVDTFTCVFLLIYLGLLLYGSISSTAYSITFNQHNNSAWAPSITPIKCIMVFGIFLTFLQVISELFKDLARAKGETLGIKIPELVLIDENSLEKSQVASPLRPDNPTLGTKS